MIHYIIQIVVFQLLFLVVYDLFLKKETFFNINRVYLLLTPVLSLVLPFIKVERFKEVVPQEYVFYLPELIMGEQTPSTRASVSWMATLSATQWILVLGSLVSLFLFIFKLIKIYQLKMRGKKVKHHQFTEIIIQKSNAAFSFFKNIFLGEEVIQKEYKHIIEHELVHINQRHSWDLIFFEILRIVFWFNPLIYIYQSRTTELHEFIADAHTVKTNKKEHYQHLLEEVFKTENISFINQFFNHSLIKKRIVMLQKSKSKKVWQLKYLLLVPVLIGMLIYTSCTEEDNNQISSSNMENVIKSDVILKVNNLFDLSEEEERSKIQKIDELKKINKASTLTIIDNESNSMNILIENGYIEEFNVKKNGKGQLTNSILNGIDFELPLSSIKVKPSFKTPCPTPGMDHDECFMKMLNEHVINTFKYPKEAYDNKIEGKAYVNFKINTDGTVEVINTRAPHPLLDKEARRIIESLPTFNPGTDDEGNIAPVTFAYPIVFKL